MVLAARYECEGPIHVYIYSFHDANSLPEKGPKRYTLPRFARQVTILIDKDAGRELQVDLAPLGWTSFLRRAALGAHDYIYIINYDKR